MDFYEFLKQRIRKPNEIITHTSFGYPWKAYHIPDNNNEVMYGTTEDIYLQCKLNFISNNHPNFKTDNGIIRRGILQEFTNKFVNKEAYNNSNGQYLLDPQLLNKFTNEKYKNCFTNMISKYSKLFYAEYLIIPHNIRTNFVNICYDNDKMKDFIDNYIEITNDDNDRIYKGDFLDKWNEVHNSNNTWNYLLSDIKRCNLIYNRNKRINKDKYK